MARRRSSPASSFSPRRTETEPEDGCAIAARIFRSVVFPLPFFPFTARNPESARKESFEKRGGPAKALESSRASRVAGITSGDVSRSEMDRSDALQSCSAPAPALKADAPRYMIRRIHVRLDVRLGARPGRARWAILRKRRMSEGDSMSKRLTTILLALAVALTFAACGSKEDEE